MYDNDPAANRDRYMQDWYGKPSKPGNINPRVLKQGTYWWDLQGNGHLISHIDKAYALNVIEFCYQHSRLRLGFPFSNLSGALRDRILS